MFIETSVPVAASITALFCKDCGLSNFTREQSPDNRHLFECNSARVILLQLFVPSSLQADSFVCRLKRGARRSRPVTNEFYITAIDITVARPETELPWKLFTVAQRSERGERGERKVTNERECRDNEGRIYGRILVRGSTIIDDL